MPLTDEAELPLISGQSQHAVLVDRAFRRIGAILRRSSTIALAGGTRTLSADEAAVRFLKFTGTASIVVLGRAGEWAIRNGTNSVVTVAAVAGGASVDIAVGDTVQVLSDGVAAFGLAAGAVSWGAISGKPTTFAPSPHDHDASYYTKAQVDTGLAGKSDLGHTHGVTAIAPTLTSGWVNQGPTYSAAGYYRDTTGRVWLKGIVKSGTMSAAMFTLPAGYRPTTFVNLPTVAHNGTALVPALLEVQSTGSVVPTFGANATFVLDGLSFLPV